MRLRRVAGFGFGVPVQARAGGGRNEFPFTISQRQRAALLGESPSGRTSLIEQGGPLALRDGEWKFIPPATGARLNGNTKTETGNSPQPQLFNLANDIGETNNLASAQPERAKKMAVQLETIRRAQPIQ